MTVDHTLAQAGTRGAIRPRRRVDGIVERVLDGELVVYDTSGQRVHILNPVAALIWYLCDGDHLPQHIVSELIERYPEHQSSIRDDVLPILETFAREDLLAA